MYNSITIQIVLASFLWTCFSTSAIAQRHHETSQNAKKKPFVGKDRVRALRIAFFVEELELTAEESQEFWPIAHAAQQKFRYNGDLIRAKEDSLQKYRLDTLYFNEQNCMQRLNELDELHHQGIDLKSDFIKDALEVIGYERASKLPIIERNFRKSILNKKIGDNNIPPPPPKLY
jgi:hypothetical protein